MKRGWHDAARAALSAAIAVCRALEMPFWLSHVEATWAKVEGRGSRGPPGEMAPGDRSNRQWGDMGEAQ